MGARSEVDRHSRAKRDSRRKNHTGLGRDIWDERVRRLAGRADLKAGSGRRGRLGIVINLRLVAAHSRNEQHSQQETSDVSPPRDASRLRAAKRADAAQELHGEPQSNEKHRGQAREKPPKEKRDKREDARRRKKYYVCAEHSCNGAARAESGDRGTQTENRLRDTRAQSAHEIETEVGQVAEAVFHIRAKEPEKPHVADNVQPSRMKKHGSKQGEEALREGVLRVSEGQLCARRDHRVSHDERLQRARVKRELVEEDDEVDDDECECDGGEVSSRAKIF